MRKFILYSMLFLSSLLTQAQNQLDDQLLQIDTSSITSGILYERVSPFANLYNFNQSKEFNTANYSYLRQALSELYRASNEKRLISLKQLEQRIDYDGQDLVDIVILNTPFQILNYNEEYPEKGGLLFDKTTKTFKAIPNKPLFFTLQATLVAPTKKAIEGQVARFRFKPELYIKNGDNSIKDMQIDFGQGLVTTVIKNYVLRATTVNVTYSGASERIYTASITYKDGRTLTTRGKIYFKQKVNEETSRLSPTCVTADPKIKNVPEIFAEESFQGYNTDDPRIIPQAEYRVFYGDNQNSSNLKLEKPLIILDGFDPGDKRQIQDCDCENDIDCASDNVTNGVFDSEEHKSIEEFQSYLDGPEEENLLDVLRNQNYDVIVVNHPTYTTTNLDTGQDVEIDGGAYYIESNAMVLVALIKEVNQELIDNGVIDPIEAIVGPSMGGQISRYALSYMEKKFAQTGDPQWKHNVKLWISVDSPHLGANIPLGVQSLIYRLAEETGNVKAKRFYDDELGSPAAKQQLIELFRDPINSTTTNVANLNGRVAAQGYPSDDGSLFYRTYYNNLENNGLAGSHGYPQNPRKIAVVNGSLSGKKTLATPEGEVFDNYANSAQDVLSLHAFSRICIPLIVGSYCFDVRLARLGTQFMPNYASGNQEISFYKKGGGDWKRFYSSNINSRGNMDNVPGGFLNAQQEVYEAITGTQPLTGQSPGGSFWEYPGSNFELWFAGLGSDYWETRAYEPLNSFIPSFSALAHKTPNQSWSNKLNYNLVCQGDTPFDSFYGEENNTQHTSFNANSVNWLFEELAGNPQEPHFPIDSNALTVNETIVCDGESTQVYVNSICKVPGNVSSWSVSSNLNISNINGNSVTVNSTSDARSQGWVRAHFNNGQSVDKEIWVGKPAKPSYLNGTDNPPYGDIVSYYSAPTGGAESYKWYLPGNFGVFPSSTNNPTKWWITQGENDQQVYSLVGPDDGLVVVKGENKCGRGDYKNLAVTVNNDGSGGGVLILTKGMNQNEVKIFPNPAQNNVTVTLSDDSNNIGKIVIFDFKMNELKRETYNDLKNETQIEMSHFSSGLYTFMIYTNVGVFTQKVIKK